MATTTRMRVSSSTQVFHRVGAAGDLPQTDVGTSDSSAQGLGGTTDFQLEGDEGITYVTGGWVQDTTEIALSHASALNGDATIGATGFVHIKNTGFTSSAKTTAVAAGSYITIGLGETPAFATAGFSLNAGEAICLHGLGAASDRLSQIACDSSVAATYVEVVYVVSSE
jgi:hypothetical protein